ncbi:hypothetical protein [Photorhabdus asymbiotica]|uniref:hypothetical protein n=1 Tax=Photorhabdus asymbiotica TaxID=291112 RepID=UPI003DA737DD
MSVFKSLLMTAVLGTSVNTVGAATLTDSLLQCDPQFFQALYQHRAALSKVVNVEHDNKGNAWIPVKDKEVRIAFFTQPIHDKKLTLSGYYEQFDDLDKLGKYYFWGFLINEPMEAVVAATPKIHWQHSGDLYIANPQIKLKQDEPWQPNPSTTDGIAPMVGSAEKLLMLSSRNGKSILHCSIQGSIDQALLYQERPDIAAGNQ